MNLKINNYQKFSKSISMLCYGFNEEELLSTFFNKAIDLLDSITLDYEIIFIDDGSVDKTWNIAEQYQKKFNKIKIYSNDCNKNTRFSFKRTLSLANN